MTDSTRQKPMQGLVLSGGGSYAAYAVGVLRALLRGECSATQYAPLDPGVIAGASGGAFNGAVLTCNFEAGMEVAIDELTRLWLNGVADTATSCGNGAFRLRGYPGTYLDAGCLAGNPTRPFVDFAEDAVALATDRLRRFRHFLFADEPIEQRIVDQFDLVPFIDTLPIEQTAERFVSYERIRRSTIRFFVAATNWDNGSVTLFENADMTNREGPLILRASAAVPGVFPPRSIRGDQYVDGSVLLNTPLRIPIRAGADEIHVITDLSLQDEIPRLHYPNTADTLWRMLQVQWRSSLLSDLDFCGSINDGLRFLDEQDEHEPDTPRQQQAFVRYTRKIYKRIRGGTPYRRLTVHLHHPNRQLGEALGFLDFNRDRLASYMETGYQDALKHDCHENRCIVCG